ncbi:unnamed protein product [Miscanthus lutarioriparius]|uniref:Uncharacterized protein n=1 Tax=Miscanthus lutarioriparius TaxID=422564 RepID=A0A811QF51_9POAL|nr:unnamed protein product [Miscanthus lutarioriparius]
MQAAKLSEEDGVSSSQPPELEDKSSKAKTAKSGIYKLVSPGDEVRWMALLGLALWSIMFPFLSLQQMALVLGLVLVLVLVGLVQKGLVPLRLVPLVLALITMLVSPDDAVRRVGLLGVALLAVLLGVALGRVLLGVALLGVLLGVALGRWSIMFPFLSLQQLALVLVLVLVPVQTLHRIMNFCRACMHGHGGRLLKWGPHEWVLDSGAWNHHTSNLALLLEGGYFQSQELDNKDAPSSGDDATAPHVHVLGRGSVRTDCFDFPGVHYVVGDDTRNVVSVSQLARDHGLVTVFEPTSCHVKEKKTGKIVGKGRLRNGMYILDSLHIVGQHIRDGGTSGGDRHDGADGGGGGNGDGDSTAEGRGGGGRDGRGGGGGTGAGNQGESSGSGAARGDINEINEEGEGGDEKEIEEMDDNDEDDIKEMGEINGKGEKEDDEKRGGQNSGQLSSRSHTGLFVMSRLDCICWIAILCIAACILRPYTGWGAGVTILPVNFHSLVSGFSVVLFILSFQLFKTRMSTICKEEETLGPYLQELSHQEHNKRLFGLSRFDATTDPTGYHLPAGAFPASSTNAARREEFLLDSGASFHMTWNEWILIPYPKDLKDHTEPPTRRFGGIIGSIAVKASGYLSSDKIKLDGVLLAPDSRMNLVSVGQLSIQYEVNVEMDDKGFVIKKKQGGVQIGGGKMIHHLYVLEYLNPGVLFALSPTPDFKTFGTSVSSSASEVSKEDDGAVAEPSGPEGEVAKPRKRQPNKRLFGPEWSN